MNLRTKIIIAKELKRLGIAIGFAFLSFVAILILGLYYEKQEYPKYQKKKADVKAEVAEWKKETLKRNEELATKKSLASFRLQAYITTNPYFSQDYENYLLQLGWNNSSGAAILYARSILNEGFYNDHMRKLDLLLQAYENCPSGLDIIEIMQKEHEQLFQVSSFSQYRKHYGSYHPIIGRTPPVGAASYLFLTILYYYLVIRMLILVVRLIVKSVKWVNRTSKLQINSSEENGKK